MGIKIINSFELNSPLPLDARAVANNINEMNELITKNFVVAGQMCYNKADNKLYVLKKNSEGALISWHEVADSVDLDNINKVLPTDIAIKDNKLGLEHDNVWLTNQNAINLSGFKYDDTTKTLSVEGGGKSVPPTLVLFDVKTNKNRTTITEEELTNMANGLYNSVLFVDETLGEAAFSSLYLPTSFFFTEDIIFFSIFVSDDINDKATAIVKGINTYGLTLDAQNADGTYSFTVEKFLNFPFSGGSGGGSSIILRKW